MTEILGCFPIGLMSIYRFNYFYCAITKIGPWTSFFAREKELRDCKLAYLGRMVIVAALSEIEEGILMQLIARC